MFSHLGNRDKNKSHFVELLWGLKDLINESHWELCLKVQVKFSIKDTYSFIFPEQQNNIWPVISFLDTLSFFKLNVWVLVLTCLPHLAFPSFFWESWNGMTLWKSYLSKLWRLAPAFILESRRQSKKTYCRRKQKSQDQINVTESSICMCSENEMFPSKHME